MTVICYRSEIMASDGRVTEDSSIFSNKHKKIFRLKSGGLLGTAGDADDRDVVTLLDKCKGKLPTHKQLLSLEMEMSAILAQPDGKVYVLEAGKEEKEERWVAAIFEINEPFIAVGSGSAWAMGAMDRGATAEQAVKTAIKYNNTCGGAVQVFKLKEV